MGGGSPPFIIPTITYKVVVFAPSERADTLPLFLLYTYMYSVVFSFIEISYVISAFSTATECLLAYIDTPFRVLTGVVCV
jgi:hypothetical protein